MNPSKTLEQYLRATIERGVIDHALRARVDEHGDVVFYIHPVGVDGDTLDYRVRGDELSTLHCALNSGETKR